MAYVDVRVQESQRKECTKRLFHGTERDNIPKINRSFCGKNSRTRQHMGREFILLWMPAIPLNA